MAAIIRHDIIGMLVKAYNENSDFGQIKPVCDNIKEVLKRLKDEGKKLIVVTTDNCEITQKCLRSMGIDGFFDAVFADDGETPLKPNPGCVLEYCKLTGIDPDKTVMVGDTMTDVKFARNAGIAMIGVGKTPSARQKLCEYADAVIEDISHIFDVAEEMI